MSKAPLSKFLAQNPFPHPLTQGFFYREKMRAIHTVAPEMTPETEPPKILEVGGGQSGLSTLLFPTGHVTNIDLDPIYADAACNQQPNVTFVCGDATELPFENETFDLITLFDLLEHVLDHQKAVDEALRVLKPDGHLLLSTPNENWRFPYYDFFQPFCPKDTDVMAEWGHVRRGYSMAELQSLVKLPCRQWMTFIDPVTVLCHDIAFSRLSQRKKTIICRGLSPLTWSSYWLHRPHSKGTETAYAWQKN